MVQPGRDAMRSLMWMRWVLVGLSLLLAAAFVARGNFVIGGLLAAMGVTRFVMITKTQQRRRELRQRFGPRPDPPG